MRAITRKQIALDSIDFEPRIVARDFMSTRRNMPPRFAWFRDTVDHWRIGSSMIR